MSQHWIDIPFRLGAAAGLALLLAGCGGGGGQPAKPPAPAAAAQSSTPEPAPADFEPDLEAGKRVFTSVCITCHGPDGRGIPKTGADLVHSKFVREHTDEELVAYVKRGRRVTDPENIMGLEMPPKGGAPYLDDEAIRNVVAYVRSLQENAED